MRLLRQARNALAQLRSRGILSTTRYAVEKLSESYHEWQLGIRTSGKVLLAELGIDNPFSVDYYPSDYRSIYKAFRYLRVCPNQDVFLDYGAGLGRVVVVAGTLPFRKVIGVEISPQLSAIAKANVSRARNRMKCQDLEIVTGDAVSYRVPFDVNVVFFYNPFHGPVLTSVLSNIRESLRQSPRKLSIVFKNSTFLESEVSHHDWLVKRHEFRAFDGNHKVLVLGNR